MVTSSGGSQPYPFEIVYRAFKKTTHASAGFLHYLPVDPQQGWRAGFVWYVDIDMDIKH